MCGCEAHWNARVRECSCNCESHAHLRFIALPRRSNSPKEQYWVTERPMGLESTNEQMRFLNSLLTDKTFDYTLQGCDPHGHYIFKMTLKEN